MFTGMPYLMFCFVSTATPERVKKQMLEKCTEGKRLKEEKVLLEKDMTGFLKYFRNSVIPQLVLRILSLNQAFCGKVGIYQYCANTTRNVLIIGSYSLMCIYYTNINRMQQMS